MSRTLATTLGMASLLLFAVVTFNDVETIAGSPGLPHLLLMLALMFAGILANAFFTFKIVRGRRPQPAYARKELIALIQEAVGEQMRTEIETVVLAQMFRMGVPVGPELDTAVLDADPKRPATRRPHLVKATEGD